jgi:hypothetical protein
VSSKSSWWTSIGIELFTGWVWARSEAGLLPTEERLQVLPGVRVDAIRSDGLHVALPKE